MNKLDVARHQLGTALQLFIHDDDPVSVQCLACGAGEILDHLADEGGAAKAFSSHIMQTYPELDIGDVKRFRNGYWNAFKHATKRDSTTRDDTELLTSFSDKRNDGPLYIAWHDYQSVTGKLPVAAQVFQVWYLVIYAEKIAPDSSFDMRAAQRVFPDLKAKVRRQQKECLQKVIKRYETHADVLGDEATDKLPLIVAVSY